MQDKLMGIARFGLETDFEGEVIHEARFAFTNPDCGEPITIDRLIIFESSGDIMYFGPLLQQSVGYANNEETVVASGPWAGDMKPHETRYITLWTYIKSPQDPTVWLPRRKAVEKPADDYTVEIFFTRTRRRQWGFCPVVKYTYAAPLIGQTSVTRSVKEPASFRPVLGYGYDMVHLQQEFPPQHKVG